MDLHILAAAWEPNVCDHAKNVRIAALSAVFTLAKLGVWGEREGDGGEGEEMRGGGETLTPVVIAEEGILMPPRLTSNNFSSFPDRSMIDQRPLIASSRDPEEVKVASTYLPPTLSASNSLMAHLNRSNYELSSPIPTAQVSMRNKDLVYNLPPVDVTSAGQRPRLPGSNLSAAGRAVINKGVPSQVTVIPIQPAKRLIPLPLAPMGAAALALAKRPGKITQYLVKGGLPKRVDL